MAYNEALNKAVKTVLIEMCQILGAYRDKFVIVGGSVPWLLYDQSVDSHVGTMDIDIGLDAEALLDNNEYADLVQLLLDHGYYQRQDGDFKRFQLIRNVSISNEQPPIDVVVDFLMPRNLNLPKNKPPIIDDFAVQGADGVDIALRLSQEITIKGQMPKGGTNSVTVRVASVPALLAMKGYAIEGRYKTKDAYDIYYCIRNYPGGVKALADSVRPHMNLENFKTGIEKIANKFQSTEDYGPSRVIEFMSDYIEYNESDRDQLQRDAYGQVDAFLSHLGIR